MSADAVIGGQGARATIPAMPNAHSHAFQRALRGRAERPGVGEDDFWTWRTEMFRLAEALDPTTMRQLAFETYAEMRGAGYGVVGEFHYVHHQPDGTPYSQPNEMAFAVAEAALEARLPIVLLPAAYNRGGWADGSDLPPAPGQRRFCDPDVSVFLDRVEELRMWATRMPGVEVGIAAHSVRAVPRSWLEAIAAYSERQGIVRHVHASEQRRELAECQAEHGCSPIELLADTGFLGPRASVIHGIHVSPADVEILRGAGAMVVSCPTTEGNLGDGYLPAMAYAQARVPLGIGSDSQVRIDPFEEARELETGSRRERQLRTGLLAVVGDLWAELCRNGYVSLGVDPALVIERSVTIDLEHPDLRGIDAADLPLALVTCASAGVVLAP